MNVCLQTHQIIKLIHGSPAAVYIARSGALPLIPMGGRRISACTEAAGAAGVSCSSVTTARFKSTPARDRIGCVLEGWMLPVEEMAQKHPLVRFHKLGGIALHSVCHRSDPHCREDQTNHQSDERNAI